MSPTIPSSAFRTHPDHSFFKRCQEKVLFFDGGMGSMLQTYTLNEDDFEGKEGCNEILVRTRPESCGKFTRLTLKPAPTWWKPTALAGPALFWPSTTLPIRRTI